MGAIPNSHQEPVDVWPATHPGGGIMGAPGRIAAMEILKDWKA